MQIRNTITQPWEPDFSKTYSFCSDDLRCLHKAAFTLIYILMVNILIYILICRIYKQLRLYINLYIKKEHVLLLRNDHLYSIYTFQIKSSLI